MADMSAVKLVRCWANSSVLSFLAACWLISYPFLGYPTSQGAQYGLSKEYGLDYIGMHKMISGIFLC